MRQDDVGRERNQFRGVSASFLGVAFGPAHVDANVASNDPPGLRQRLLERPEPSLKVCIICGGREKHADTPYALSLLRLRRERPCRRHATQRGYQFSPSDMDCHATLPWGSCPCNAGQYHASFTQSAATATDVSRESKPGDDYRIAIFLYSMIARFKSSYSSQGMRQIRSRASRCSSALVRSPCTRCASPRCSCALRCRGLRISACR